jgi:hypothetical protein
VLASLRITGLRLAAATATVVAAVAVAIGSALSAPASHAADTAPPFHPPIGPYAPLTESAFEGVSSYRADDRLVLTSYFYWYDVYTAEHLTNADGSDALTDHPATLTGFSYRSAAWHRTQLLDMMEAGIDILLPVYWGEPSQRIDGAPVDRQPWSFAGLPPLVAARDDLVRQGRIPPRIGLLYDTSTLQFNAAGEQIDLTTARGRQWFYETVRDFFSLVPPRHWAMIEGRPVVVLYSASFAKRHDQTCIDELRTQFARDFAGRTPFVIREISWNVRADQVYAWGGALGTKNPGVASLGPGYDHSAVPGRTPLIVPREDGAFFERNWLAFLRRPSRLVMIETWNEFHEGTDIAHSREYGRQYLALNRKYADLFKAGYQPPPLVGPYTGARLVEIDLAATNRSAGISHLDQADGLTRADTIGGIPCRVTVTNVHGSRYLYLKIDDSFKWADPMRVDAVVEYFDAVRGTLRIEFDGSDPAAPFQGAYTASAPAALSGSRTWRTAVFRLDGARFQNGQNGGADLRLSVGQAEVPIRRVQILREGLAAVTYRPEAGFEFDLLGVPGTAYDVEVSRDLRAWEAFRRLQPTTPRTRLHDEPVGGGSARWYRARPATGG